MNLKKDYSRTFIKILSYIVIVILFLIIIFSSILYSTFQKVGLDLTYEYNKKIMSHLSYNVNYMNEMVKNFALTQFVEPDNVALIYQKQDDFDFQKNINKLQRIIASNSIIHSAVLYNNYLKETYCTYGAKIGEDQDIINKINEKKDIPILSPIPRVLPKGTYGQEGEVFTYYIYENTDKEGIINGALILNVKNDWLKNNIERSAEKDDNIIIVDENGSVILDSSSKLKLFQKLDNVYMSHIKNNDYLNDSKIVTVNNEKRVLTYIPISGTKWIMINNQSYEKVFKHIKYVKNITIIATILFIILGIIISVLLSKKIYKPFGNLVKQIKEATNEKDNSEKYKDDTEFIKKAFNVSSSKLKEFEEYKYSTEIILKENAIKAMLLESDFIKSKFYKDNFKEISDFFIENNSFILIIFKIDSLNKFIAVDEEEQSLTKFVIYNIADEILGNNYKYQRAFMGKDQFVYIVRNEESVNKQHIDILKENIKQIQLMVHKISKFSISAYISRQANSINELYNIYQDTAEFYKFNLTYGNGCILDNEMVRKHISNNIFNYPKNLENRLVEELKMGNLDEIKKVYLDFIDVASKGSIEEFHLFIMQMVIAINKTIEEIDSRKPSVLKSNLSLNYSNLMQLSSLNEINEIFIDLFDGFMEMQKNKATSKQTVIVNSIIDYIQQEYAKDELSAQLIADKFKMSVVYLGQVFKEVIGMSILEYINDVRIKKAAHLLETTNYSGREIIAKVGYCNESNFYKLFKKQYGITPNEYRKNIVMLQQET